MLACTPGSGCVKCTVIHSHFVYFVRWEASGYSVTLPLPHHACLLGMCMVLIQMCPLMF